MQKWGLHVIKKVFCLQTRKFGILYFWQPGEVFIEYGYETLESALRECDEWNSKDKTLEKEAIFASKKELSDILEITITLVDGSELFFELDKNGKCLSDFFKISAGCSIDDVKFEKGIIKEVSFSETWEWRRELCVKSRKSEKV